MPENYFLVVRLILSWLKSSAHSVTKFMQLRSAQNSYKINQQIIITEMGIVGAIRTHCLAGAEEDKTAVFLDPHGKTINDDYTYFQQENWFRLQSTILFDPNKFIFLFTNYKETQQKLNNQWRIVDTKKFKTNEKLVFNDEPLQAKWVYAIRRGVPIRYYKNVIEMMFAKNFGADIVAKKYQALLYEKVKKNGNKIEAATFQQQSEQTTFATPYLNKQGMEAAKRITFLLSKTHSQLEYNLYIVNVISLLLIFISEADTYDIVGTMIDGSTSMSVDRQESLRWHFTLTNNQLQKYARDFFKTVKDISPSIRIINQHLNTEGIDKFEIFKEIIGDMFIGFLPFHAVLDIFIIFLNEGAKMFYRFFYAILKVTGQSIRDSSNTKQIIRVIRTKLLISLSSQRHIKQFFKYAYDLQLENLLIRKSELELKRKISKKQYNTIYYLPEVTGESQILSFADMETIWEFLPKIIKHYDVKKIFESSQGSLGLKKMLNCLQENYITLVIIQATNDSVFGVFFAQKLKTIEEVTEESMVRSLVPSQGSFASLTKSLNTSLIPDDPKHMKHSLSSRTLGDVKDVKYFGSSQNFVFTLHPTSKKFPATGQNVFYNSYTEDGFAVGGPQPALELKSTVAGVSFSSLTYCNDPLHGGTPGEFRIKIIECFSIQ